MSKQTVGDCQEKIERINKQYHSLKKKRFKSNVDVREMLRLKALKAYYKGQSLKIVALCYDISVKTLKGWIKQFEKEEQVRDAPRSGRPSKLSDKEKETLKAIIVRHKELVWTARHVLILLQAVFGVCYNSKYLPELLRSLGLSYHKALHTLAKKNNEKRRRWIEETLPSLYAKAIQEGWRLFSVDEVGFQTEGTLAKSWGLKGEKIEIDNYGRRGRMNLIGAFELGTGQFYGVLTSFRVNSQRFRRFLCHLKREMRNDKLILICDNASFHKAKWLKQWYQQQTDWLHIEFLPGYSPDFNPIERLWRWIKTEYTHNQCWAKKQYLRLDLRRMLNDLKHRADELKSVMKLELERLKQTFHFYDTPCPFD